MANDTSTPIIIARKEAKALGLTTYFTGKPCKAGHIETRRTDNGNCSECDRAVQRVRSRERYHDDPEKAKQSVKDYRARNLEIVNSRLRHWARERRQVDVQWRLRTNAATRLNHIIERIVRPVWMTEIGCTLPELIKWIESQFQPGMSWDNYGEVWWIDHKEPLSSFDLTDREQYLAATHHTNLQPLPKFDNIRKGGIRRPRE